eukprot:6850543-Pyramimonas_sp.AAC.1
MMSHRVWIDDVCQKSTGSRQAARSNLIRGVVKTGQELAKAGLKLAKKPVVMCTNAADARCRSGCHAEGHPRHGDDRGPIPRGGLQLW